MKIIPVSMPFPFMPPDPNRSPGASEGGNPHVSEIIKSYMKSYGTWEYGDDLISQLPESDRLRMEMGFFWEDGMEKRLGDHVFRPDEVECEGIVGSPDGQWIDFTDFPSMEGGHGLDYKMTKTSANKSIHDRQYWIFQAQMYCYMCGWNVFDWLVCYVDGNYRDRREWIFKPIRVEFSDVELRETWNLFKNEAIGKGMMKDV